jgi:CBS-domain-containing membrane protein
MNIQEIMDTELVTVDPAMPVVEAAKRMRDHSLGLLPVIEDERLIGVITDRDLTVRVLAEGLDASCSPVRDIMSIEIICGFPEEPAESAEARMMEEGVRRLPVIDHDHHLLGVVRATEFKGGASTKTAKRVTFVRAKTDSYGRPHDVPLKTVYVTGARSKEQATEKAVETFQKELGPTSWSDVQVDEAPEGKRP